MGFAIIRTQKLKHLASVSRSMKHAFREQDTPNADPSQLQDNTHIGAQSEAEAYAKLKALLPEKRRSDAVLAIEYLVSASPEDMKGKTREQQDAYLLDALKWIQDRHGAQNVTYAGIHRDETTPHLYAYAVPLDPDSGRLNAKRWLGGAKALQELQTDFAHRVGRPHGLERGRERSKATHTTIREYYGRVNEPLPPVKAFELPPPSLIERTNPKAYGQRVADAVIAQVNPELKAQHAKTLEAQRQVVELQAEISRMAALEARVRAELAKMAEQFGPAMAQLRRLPAKALADVTRTLTTFADKFKPAVDAQRMAEPAKAGQPERSAPKRPDGGPER